jgi:hypothetical protein
LRPSGRLLAAVALVALIGTGCANAPVDTGNGGGGGDGDEGAAVTRMPGNPPHAIQPIPAASAREPTKTYSRGDTEVRALRGIDLLRGGVIAIMLTARQNIPLPLDQDAALHDGRIA